MDIGQLLHSEDMLKSLLSAIQTLQNENEEIKIEIKELQKHVNNLELYSKMNNLIISEFNIEYKSYGRSPSTHDVDDYTQTNSETEIKECKVVPFLKRRHSKRLI